MGGNETMTKRFWSEDYTVGYYTEVVDNEKILEDVPNPKKNLTIDELVDLLNEQDQQIKQTKDAFYEAHKQQQDCLKEVLKLYDEKRELEFKLNTLKKAYLCRTCTFNNKEMRYLKSLRE